MKLTTLLTILSFSTLFFFQTNDEYGFEVKTSNGGHFKVRKVFDTKGVLKRYTADIIAPVCEEGVCYDVHVIFNWDIVGKFTDFQTYPMEPLTKLDHIPFSPQDYEKLQSILTNHDLVFTGMPASELVVKNKAIQVDGYSGATLTAIKDEVIAGAIFTCHTLWHIANGAVVDSIKAHTKAHLNKTLVTRIADNGSVAANYYLIESLSSEKFKENLTVILELIKQGGGYFPKNAFERFPVELFATREVQEFLAANFNSFDYYTQVAVLQKLKSSSISVELLNSLLPELNQRNSILNQKIIELLINFQNGSFAQKLVDHLVENQLPVSRTTLKQLEELNLKKVQLLQTY